MKVLDQLWMIMHTFISLLLINDILEIINTWGPCCLWSVWTRKTHLQQIPFKWGTSAQM